MDLQRVRIAQHISRFLYSHSLQGSTFFRQFFCVGGIVLVVFFGNHGINGTPTATPPTVTRNEYLTSTCGQACEYENRFYRAHCDQRELSFVPISSGCEGVSLLELQNNNVTSIATEQMSGYTVVRTFDISRNQISSLEPGTFNNNHQMRNILASHNEIQILQRGTFNGTERSIQRIYLDHNKLQVIENGTFYGLAKLQILSLQKNRLQEVSEGLFAGLYAMEQVNLSCNVLTHISSPAKLGFSYLPILDLQKNQLYQCAVIVPFLYNITDEFHFGDNPLVCDCHFMTIQKWFYETNYHQKSQIMCKVDNETRFDVTDNLTIPCNEISTTETNPKESIMTTSQSLRTDTSSSITFNEQNTSSSFTRKENHVSIFPKYDDDKETHIEIFGDDRKILRHEYIVPWISYYTAAILTIYVIFWLWTHRWKRKYKKVKLIHFKSTREV